MSLQKRGPHPRLVPVRLASVTGRSVFKVRPSCSMCQNPFEGWMLRRCVVRDYFFVWAHQLAVDIWVLSTFWLLCSELL